MHLPLVLFFNFAYNNGLLKDLWHPTCILSVYLLAKLCLQIMALHLYSLPKTTLTVLGECGRIHSTYPKINLFIFTGS